MRSGLAGPAARGSRRDPGMGHVMRPMWRGAIAAVVVLALAGCSRPESQDSRQEMQLSHLGPARGVVLAAIDALGGQANWQQAGAIHAKATVTVVDPDGRAEISFQRQEIDVSAGRLSAVADAGSGQWRAVVNTRGDLLWGTRRLPRGEPRTHLIAESLAMLLRRVQGPFALVTGQVTCTSVTPARLEGRRVLRVAVDAPKTGETAYYFDEGTGLLAYVTAGSERPGDDGTVTMYRYAAVNGGATFPVTVRVVRTGKYVLLGSEAVLEAEFSSVRFD